MRKKTVRLIEIVWFILIAVTAIIYSFFSDAIHHINDQPLIIKTGVVIFFLGAIYFAIAIAWFFYCWGTKFNPKFRLCSPIGNLAVSFLILMIAFVLFTIALI